MVTVPRRVLEESAREMLEVVGKDLESAGPAQVYIEADRAEWENAKHNLSTLEKIYCGLELIEDRGRVGDPFAKSFELGQEVWIRRVERTRDKNEFYTTTRHSTLACLLLQGAVVSSVAARERSVALKRRHWSSSV
jgi:hypothetical protein